MTQQLLNGIQIGAIYALFAVGFTIIFGVHRIMNLAQGSILTAGGLLAYALSLRLHADFAVTLLLGMASGAIVSIVIDLLAFRQLRRANAPEESTLVASIGISLIIDSIAQQATHTQLERFPASVFLHGSVKLFGATVTELQLVTVLLCLAITTALTVYLKFTRAGRKIRAVSADARTATLLAIRPSSIYLRTFAICGAVTGAAGVLVGLYVSSLSYQSGDDYLLIGIAAVVLGGMGSIPGAVIAGFAIGIIEALTVQYVSSTWSFAAPFIIMFIILVVRPEGLLGSYDPRAAVGRTK